MLSAGHFTLPLAVSTSVASDAIIISSRPTGKTSGKAILFLQLPPTNPPHWLAGSTDAFSDLSLAQEARTLARDHKKRFRSGQTRERIPSNAWARKIAALTKPITAVKNIANVPLRHCATENGGDLAQSKRFPGTNTQSRSTGDFAQQVLSRNNTVA